MNLDDNSIKSFKILSDKVFKELYVHCAIPSQFLTHEYAENQLMVEELIRSTNIYR